MKWYEDSENKAFWINTEILSRNENMPCNHGYYNKKIRKPDQSIVGL